MQSNCYLFDYNLPHNASNVNTSKDTVGDLQAFDNDLSVKVYPELGYAAKLVKETKELSMWYELRALIKFRNHSGFIPLQEATKDFHDIFNYSYQTFRRILKLGEGIYWHEFYNEKRGIKYIELFGLGKICLHLNIVPTQRPVIITVKDFIGRRLKNAWIYGAFNKTQGTPSKFIHPILRKVIEKVTHTKTRTQQRYDKILKTEIITNTAVDCNGNPEIVTYQGKSQEYKVQKKFGNSYIANSQKGFYGVLYWMNQGDLIPKYAPYCQVPRKASGLEIMRKFFNTARAYTSCKHPKTIKCYIRHSVSDYHINWMIA